MSTKETQHLVMYMGSQLSKLLTAKDFHPNIKKQFLNFKIKLFCLITLIPLEI